MSRDINDIVADIRYEEQDGACTRHTCECGRMECRVKCLRCLREEMEELEKKEGEKMPTRYRSLYKRIKKTR